MAKHAKRDLSFLNQPMFADILDEIIYLIEECAENAENEAMYAISDKMAEAIGPVRNAREAANQYHNGTLEVG